MKKIVFSEEQIKDMVHMYTVEIKGLKPIGIKYGVSNYVIKRTLKENGVEIDTPGQRFKGGRKVANKRWQEKNKERLSEYHKQWSKKNREHLRNYHQQWRDDNREYVNEYKRKYEKHKKDTDPSYKLACYTRTAIYTCLKERNINKYENTFNLLPYTLEELMEHLESQFVDNMSWDNYGDWHVDHIKPMTSFIMESPEDKEFQDCWALKNLQPLWAEDNLSKGSRV
jgi:hypothetical protein